MIIILLMGELQGLDVIMQENPITFYEPDKCPFSSSYCPRIQLVTKSCWFYLLNSSWIVLSFPSLMYFPAIDLYSWITAVASYIEPLFLPQTHYPPYEGCSRIFSRVFLSSCCFPAYYPPSGLQDYLWIPQCVEIFVYWFEALWLFDGISVAFSM